jgi:hypothetical protein
MLRPVRIDAEQLWVPLALLLLVLQEQFVEAAVPLVVRHLPLGGLLA